MTENVPELLEWRRDLAGQALEGASFQMTAAARFLALGDDRQAVDAYRRAVAIIREYASPDMRMIAEALEDRVEQLTQPSREAAAAEGEVPAVSEVVT